MPGVTALDEGALVARAQQGDPDAFAGLVQLYQRFVYNLALRVVNDPAEAEDLAQEAFVRAWQALPRFRREAKFRTWLYRIVVNLCYNRLDHLKRELETTQPLDPDDDWSPGPGEAGGGDPAQRLLSQERRLFLHRQVQSLPQGYRMMVLMRYVEDMPYEEIAEAMDLPLGTVKTGLFRAHRQLRLALHQYEQVTP